jgi:hypothetical protein
MDGIDYVEVEVYSQQGIFFFNIHVTNDIAMGERKP